MAALAAKALFCCLKGRCCTFITAMIAGGFYKSVGFRHFLLLIVSKMEVDYYPGNDCRCEKV
jgi:hypothetical protein